MGRAGSDYSSDGSGRSELSDDDSLEASLYGGPDDTRLRPRYAVSVVMIARSFILLLVVFLGF